MSGSCGTYRYSVRVTKMLQFIPGTHIGRMKMARPMVLGSYSLLRCDEPLATPVPNQECFLFVVLVFCPKA